MKEKDKQLVKRVWDKVHRAEVTHTNPVEVGLSDVTRLLQIIEEQERSIRDARPK